MVIRKAKKRKGEQGAGILRSALARALLMHVRVPF